MHIKFTKVSTMPLMLLVLLLSSNGSIVVQSSTIPCPGFDDPSTFLTIPLSDRPKLSKILQHGYQPNLLTATLPSRDKANLVQTHEGFVDRPFRRITPDNCPFEDGSVRGFRCYHSSSASFGSANGNPAEQQCLLEMASRFTEPRVDSYLNPSYTDVWANEVRQFMADNNVDCQEDTSSLVTITEYGCTVGGCFEIEPEFVTDLHFLDAQVSGTNLDAFETFIDKWGHGGVQTVRFGAMESSIYVPVTADGEPTAGSIPTLYMGRAGGSGEMMDGLGILYTEEECADPAPVSLVYTPWEDIFDELFPIWYLLEYNLTDVDLDGIGEKFRQVRQTYPFLFQEISEADIDLVNCPRLDPGALTSSPSSAAPTTNATVETGAPTTVSSISPTDTPTTAPHTEPSPTNAPSVTPAPSLRSFFPTSTSSSSPPPETSSDDDSGANGFARNSGVFGGAVLTACLWLTL